jgi:hypothetical protein
MALIFTTDLLLWIWIVLLVIHTVIICITDYGPGAPKLCCNTRLPLWFMYAFDWAIVCVFAFGPYLIPTCSAVGVLIYGTLTGIGILGLLFLQPFPHENVAPPLISKQEETAAVGYDSVREI